MDAAPYYAPTYFSPSYFPESTPLPIPSTGVAPYFAPTYFPPAFFYGGMLLPVVVPVDGEPTGPDQPPYSALLSMLRATGAFQEVIFGDSLQRGQAGADGYPLAVVSPKGWDESDEWDPALILRRVSFTITIAIKSEDADTRFDSLDRLSAIVQGVVDRSDLGGHCLGALTKIHAGRYGQATHHPEQSIALDGDFASLIDPLASANSAI